MYKTCIYIGNSWGSVEFTLVSSMMARLPLPEALYSLTRSTIAMWEAWSP